MGMDVVYYGLLAQAAGPEWNGTEIHRWCVGDRMANGRAHIPFQQNGMERKCQRFYVFYCSMHACRYVAM